MTLEVDKLRCARGGQTVRDGVRFDLAAGDAATLVGPNGAGKSTLLRTIAGLLPPVAGGIRLCGIARADDEPGFRAHLAYAGHLDALKPALSVQEMLAGWAAIYDADDDAPNAALAAFDLAALADLPVRVLSAGQKRRLGLARLMLLKASLWLLDEPTVSLDAAATQRLCALIEAHRARGGMALIATHLPLDLAKLQTIPLEGSQAPPKAGPLTDATLTGDAW